MKKWMKVVGGMMVAALVVTVFAGVALAQGPSDDSDGVRDLTGAGLGQGRGPAYGFVDEDGDGINDRYLSDPDFVDEDGDGVCDIHGVVPGEGYGSEFGPGYGRGWGFVDEDGDGINDRYLSDPDFVDEDGDGVCDLYSDGSGYGSNARAVGRGMGRGRWAAGQ